MTNTTAHPGKRFQAQFIDALISYAFGYATFFLLKNIINIEIAGYTGIAVGLCYFLLSDALPNGQSLGKKLLKIRVVGNKSGKSCSIIQAFFRNITTPLGIFDWVFILSKSRRRLGDLLASTVVVLT